MHARATLYVTIISSGDFSFHISVQEGDFFYHLSRFDVFVHISRYYNDFCAHFVHKTKFMHAPFDRKATLTFTFFCARATSNLTKTGKSDTTPHLPMHNMSDTFSHLFCARENFYVCTSPKMLLYQYIEDDYVS